MKKNEYIARNDSAKNFLASFLGMYVEERTERRYLQAMMNDVRPSGKQQHQKTMHE